MAKKLRKFTIVLENEGLMYFPGQFVSGKVLVELEEDTSVIGVYFHVVGEGVVRLIDKNRARVTDKENYIDFRMKLLGETDHRECVLSPGIHSFPFKLGLPLGLPSTFLGKHGWVQYFCKTAIKDPSSIVHTVKQVFIVMNPIDLSLEPAVISQPVHCEIKHQLKPACWTGNPISVRVRLDRGGYVSGESVLVHANIHNGSNVTLNVTRAQLSETIQYVAKNKVIMTENRELSTVTRGKIRPGTGDEWNNEPLFIPPLPPTNLRGCHLIRIQYDIFFIIEPKGNKTFRLQMPIIMATYPLRNPDGTLPRNRRAHYPNNLPVVRP